MATLRYILIYSITHPCENAWASEVNVRVPVFYMGLTQSTWQPLHKEQISDLSSALHLYGRHLLPMQGGLKSVLCCTGSGPTFTPHVKHTSNLNSAAKVQGRHLLMNVCTSKVQRRALPTTLPVGASDLHQKTIQRNSVICCANFMLSLPHVFVPEALVPIVKLHIAK